MPLRVAVLMNLAPRKLGSFEAWLVALAAEALARGHRLDIFGREPVHPSIAKQLRMLGVGWNKIAVLERRKVAAVQRLRRDYDVLHINLFSRRDAIPLIAYAAWPACVLLVTRIAVRDPAAPPRPPVYRLLDRLTLRRVTSVAAVSNYVRDQVIDRFHIHARKVRTIYNGIDAERFHPPSRTPPRAGAVRVLAAGNLHPWKGMDHLFRAVASLDRGAVHLSIAGDGQEESTLRSLARTLGLEKDVEFLGLRSDLDELLRETDIFVHPVVAQEAFGLAVAEAMASGCAVIASRIGGLPELIEDGTSGLLVPPGDENAIAAALGRLVASPAERERLGVNARLRVADHFSLSRCVREHLDWCEEMAYK